MIVEDELALRGFSFYKKMNNIYKYLSHHYILKRSVVFIVDAQFDSIAYAAKAANLTSTFFESMSPTDHFGYISLGRNQNNNIPLEAKEKNTYTKKVFLKEMADVESRILSQDDSENSFQPD